MIVSPGGVRGLSVGLPGLPGATVGLKFLFRKKLILAPSLRASDDEVYS